MSERAHLSWREVLVLAMFALAMIAPGLSNLPPIDRDESRYAVATTQMLDSRDFVDIRYQDVPRHLQPAGIYWMQAGAVATLTEPDTRAIWAYRVPSLLSVIAASVLLAAAMARLFGRKAGLAAGLLLATCSSANFEGRIAKIDASLLLAVTAAQLALLHLYLDRTARTRLMAAGFWAALGVGLMLKGPIILIFVGGTIAMLLIWEPKVAWLKRLHAGWGVLITLAITLPWYSAIATVDPEFFNRAIGKNLMGKAASGQQSHGGPFGFHLAAFPLMFWPGALFAAVAAPFVWRERATPAVRFLVCWVVPGWLVYEIVATKLPHYVLPTYPAIAALAGAGLFHAQQHAPKRWQMIALALVALIWLAAGAILAGLGAYAIYEFQGVLDPWVIGLGAAGFALAVAALMMVWRGQRSAALGLAALAGLVVHVNLFAHALPKVDAFWASPRVAAAMDTLKPCPQSRLITAPYHEPSLVFLNGPYDTVLARSSEEAAAALNADRACAVALIGADRRAAFLAGAEKLGMAPRSIGKVSGHNYSDNSELDLTFYLAQ
jgi:4-amino-4-deoxy-L-arabinose transferase-like glycosyltransferase